MAVNDVIRSGATPLAISDNIHAQASNPQLVKEWLEGITQGAKQAECPVVSGEIGDVAEIIKGIAEDAGFDMIVAAIGQVDKQKIITGKGIKPDDPIIGLRSSGLAQQRHNTRTENPPQAMGRKIRLHTIHLMALDREIITEMLEPTKIYVKPVLKAAEESQESKQQST